MLRRNLVHHVLWPVLAAAALLRGMYFLEIRTRPDFNFLGLDAGYHEYWARGIAFGHWTPPFGQPDPQIRTQPFFRPPGYPYFLALVYRLSGGSLSVARLIQFALGVLNAGLVFALARRWFGGLAALLSATLAATYWAAIYYEGEWLEPTLLATLTLLMLLALGRWLSSRRGTWLLAAGVALGASAAVRPNALAFLPAAAAWAVWNLPPLPGRGRKSLGVLALLGAGAALTVAPCTLRNAFVGRDAVLISSNGGINLLFGQDREAVVDHASPDSGNWSCYDYPSIMAKASAEAGRPLRASEASAWYARKARARMVSRPRETLRLLALKSLLFWGPLEVANNKIEELERAHSRVLRLLPVRWSFVLAAAGLGFLAVIGGRSRPGERREGALAMALLAALFAASYFLSFLPFVAAGQYRLPLAPVLMVLAGAGLAHVAGLAARRQAGAAAAWLAAGACLWAVASPNYAGYRPDPARWHLARGVAAERAGQLPEAEREFRAALLASPGLGVARNRLGTLLARQDRVAEALPCFESAVAADPQSIEARFNLGLALALSHRIAESIPWFESVLRDQPEHAAARQNLDRARFLLAPPLSP